MMLRQKTEKRRKALATEIKSCSQNAPQKLDLISHISIIIIIIIIIIPDFYSRFRLVPKI
jgi:hypothetical protein